jgi:hypothetical protein
VLQLGLATAELRLWPASGGPEPVRALTACRSGNGLACRPGDVDKIKKQGPRAPVSPWRRPQRCQPAAPTYRRQTLGCRARPETCRRCRRAMEGDSVCSLPGRSALVEPQRPAFNPSPSLPTSWLAASLTPALAGPCRRRRRRPRRSPHDPMLRRPSSSSSAVRDDRDQGHWHRLAERRWQ